MPNQNQNQNPPVLPDSFFRKLLPEEEKEFRQWARENYKPGTPINPIWHPVVRQKCNRINFETLANQVDRVVDKIIDCNVAID